MRKITRALGALATLAVAGALMTALPAAAATATTTTLTSNANPSSVGQAVTLTATVAGGTPTGTVDFVESTFTLGSVTLTDGVATLVVGNWAAGSHPVTATYSGDGDDSSSAGSLTQTVVAPTPPPPPPPAPVKKPTVKLTVSSTNVEVGDKVRLSWQSKHADTVKASGDWKGKQKAKGSALVRIGDRGKHVFKLTVQNASGADTTKVTVMASRKAKELELVVTEELVTVGDEVAVTAGGLAKGEDFTIRLNGKSIITGTADKRGDVAKTIEITQAMPEGALPLTITGSNPRRLGTAVLNVVKAKSLDVEVEADKVQAKKDQTVTVTGLLPGEEVTLTYAGDELTTGTADEDGLFTYTFNVGKKKGERTVSVVGAIPTRIGKATFTVTATSSGQQL